MEMRRRRDASVPVAAAAADSHGAADDALVGAGAASSSAADGRVGDDAAAGRKEDSENLALVGQELVPLDQKVDRSREAVEEQSEEKVVSETFQTPAVQRSVTSPDPLQLQNSPHTKQNDESMEKGEQDSKSLVPVMPNGPPTSYGPPAVPPAVSPLPLFTPEQVAALNDVRTSSSLLPLGRDPAVGGELSLSRLQSFFQGLLPGFDQLQGLHEARQRELEWRSNMEMMVEQLGLQLRASQTENLRLRQELYESRKEPSRYGTPEEQSSSGKGEIQGLVHGGLMSKKEDGVVTQQVKSSKAAESSAVKKRSVSKEDGAVARQVPSLEDGAVARQDPSFEDGAVARQDSCVEDGAVAQQARSRSKMKDIEPPSEASLSEDSEGGQEDGSRDRQSPPGRASESEATMKILLKVVETMQTMQKTMMKSNVEISTEAEVVRVSPQLPRLPVTG
eukprot:s2934_g4.t1